MPALLGLVYSHCEAYGLAFLPEEFLMTNELTERLQVRLTRRDLTEMRAHTRAMGLKPGTLLRHLVLAWLSARRQWTDPEGLKEEDLCEKLKD